MDGGCVVIARRHSEPPAQWTVETLRVHFEALSVERDIRAQQRFDAQQQALQDALKAVENSTQAAFISAERATTKAEVASETRFASVNEFRQTLSDQAQLFYPRSEASAAIGALAARMEAAASVIGERIERLGQEVDALASRIDRNEGRTTGMTAGGQALIAVVGLIATVMTIVIAIGAWT